MKKVLVSLLILTLFITGCQKKEDIPNTMYSFNNLYFNLPEGFSKQNDSYYFINSGDEVISVEFKIKENVTEDILEFIKSDSEWFPNIEKINETNINGKKWYKVNSQFGSYLYYIKYKNNVYGIEINPLITTKTRVRDTILTLEGNLIVK